MPEYCRPVQVKYMEIRRYIHNRKDTGDASIPTVSVPVMSYDEGKRMAEILFLTITDSTV